LGFRKKTFRVAWTTLERAERLQGHHSFKKMLGVLKGESKEEDERRGRANWLMPSKKRFGDEYHPHHEPRP